MKEDIVTRLRYSVLGSDNSAEQDHEAADEIERLRAALEQTRQSWVDGDAPMCDEVCLTKCKGPCNVNEDEMWEEDQ